MKFVKGFFGDDWCVCDVGHRHDHLRSGCPGLWGLNLVHVARHEFDLRAGKGRAAGVFHGDPTDEVDHVLGLGRDNVVARFPRQPAGDVGQLGVELRGGGRVQFPGKRGLELGVGAERGKARLAGQRELQPALHLDDRLHSFSSGHIAAANDFARDHAIRFLRLLRHEIDRLPLEEREQQLLRDGVIAIVLFEDLQRHLACRVAQDHGVRLDLRGHAGEAHVIDAGLELQRHGLAQHGEALVVDGERRVGGARREGEGGDEGEGCESGG